MMMRVLEERSERNALIAFALVALIYGMMAGALSYLQSGNELADTVGHMNAVQTYWVEGSFGEFFSHSSYPGWHALVRLLLFFGVGLRWAAALSTASYACLGAAATGFIVWKIIGSRTLALAILTTIALLFVSAIYIPAYNSQPYYGQGSPTIWHNPTYIAVKPFALISCYLMYLMIERKAADAKICIAYAIFTLVCLVMKPSFFQVQAPTVFLFLLVELAWNRDWRFVIRIGLTFIPAFIYMALQFWVMFYSPTGGGSGVIFAPLLVYSAVSPKISISLLLLLAFPLYATIVLWRDIFKRNSPYLFFLIMLAVGFIEFALLAEGGDRLSHGNFGWGYYLAVALYWSFILPLFMKRSCINRTLGAPYIVMGVVLVAAHFVSGVIYYGMLLEGASGTMVY